jgi:hypothetical protein
MTRTNRSATHVGMNWIRQEKRLAIYLRDGLACAYCGDSVEQGAKLTLDHLKPWSKGGENTPNNLVTCCSRCNSSRGNRAWKAFAGSVAQYINHGTTAEDIISHIERCRRRTLPMAEAKELIARRGSAAKAINSL